MKANEVNPELISAKSGDTATFMCFSAKPVTWYYSNKNLKNVKERSDFNNNTYSLIIYNISQINEGVYECQGETIDGKPFYSLGTLLVMGKLYSITKRIYLHNFIFNSKKFHFLQSQ